MELKNIKANFLGDSITEGCGTTNHSTKPFHQLIAKKYDMAVARNYGIGGTRIAKQNVPSANAVWDRDFCSRYSEMDDDADLIVVFGGTNDFGHGDAPFGTFADRTPDTFYGGCHTLMKGLIEKYPEARIVFMTPLHRISEDNVSPKTGLRLADYIAAIKEVATYYSLPVLDLWSVSGIQPRVDIIKEKYCPDGLHPNDEGHERMAAVIGAFLENL